MVKRKDIEEDVEVDDTDVVNVDFDFFDIVEDDFLSLKSLIRQLLSIDNVHFNLSDLTQRLMEAKVGTTIKSDDKEYNDVLAVLGIIDFDPKQGETAKLLQYWIERCADTPEMVRTLHKINATPGAKIGMIVSERFLNMPYDVMPPLYTVLTEEYANKNLDYDYLLLPSRVYAERESEVDGKVPKAKRGAGTAVEEVFPFHPEDFVIGDEMLATTKFAFKTPLDETDSRRAFQVHGIYPYGQISVMEAKKLPQVTAKVAQLMEAQ